MHEKQGKTVYSSAVVVISCYLTFGGMKKMSLNDWKSYETAAEKGPISIGVKVILAVIVLSVIGSVIGYALGWFGEAATVVQDEFGPKAMLQKYVWFKDAAAQLDSKQASITVLEQRIRKFENDNKGVPRAKWDRTDRDNLNQWEQELAGLKISYNNLAGDYNSQMAKFNWKFANVGDLPPGAEKPLPREFKPYATN